MGLSSNNVTPQEIFYHSRVIVCDWVVTMLPVKRICYHSGVITWDWVITILPFKKICYRSGVITWDWIWVVVNNITTQENCYHFGVGIWVATYYNTCGATPLKPPPNFISNEKIFYEMVLDNIFNQQYYINISCVIHYLIYCSSIYSPIYETFLGINSISHYR